MLHDLHFAFPLRSLPKYCQTMLWFFTGVVSRITQIENITKNVNFHFLLLVFYQLSQRKCCAASYMMILEYHDRYGRRCNFSRRDRDFCFIILVFRDEIEIRYCYSHVSRRERETQIEFLKVEREKS